MSQHQTDERMTGGEVASRITGHYRNRIEYFTRQLEQSLNGDDLFKSKDLPRFKDCLREIVEAERCLDQLEVLNKKRSRTPTESEDGISDIDRTVIHNRRPDW